MTHKLLCPCHSKKPYEECCKPFHDGKPAVNAEALMRSRYSAYALLLADYIIKTTHPEHPAYNPDFEQWKKDIIDFGETTDFEDLKILEFIDGPHEATVTFAAILKRQGEDVSFAEKSHFVKLNGNWVYKSGSVMLNPPVEEV